MSQANYVTFSWSIALCLAINVWFKVRVQGVAMKIVTCCSNGMLYPVSAYPFCGVELRSCRELCASNRTRQLLRCGSCKRHVAP